jgi:hypothetical protein
VVVIGGGQSGLAGARALLDAGFRPVVLEAGERPVGSWPSYYDSLTLFSPARYSGSPGMPFAGEPGRYPVRDEVVEHLEKYAASLSAEIRTGATVAGVEQAGGGFDVQLRDGETLRAAAVVAASGSFSNPFVPVIPGRESFGGEVLHVADYRSPQPYADRRVVVVGAGNSAVQVANELAAVADVTLATRAPVQFLPQVRGGPRASAAPGSIPSPRSARPSSGSETTTAGRPPPRCQPGNAPPPPPWFADSRQPTDATRNSAARSPNCAVNSPPPTANSEQPAANHANQPLPTYQPIAAADVRLTSHRWQAVMG